MVDSSDRFKHTNETYGELEQMSLEEAQSRKETLLAERSRIATSATDRSRANSQSTMDTFTRGLTLAERITYHARNLAGRGPEWQYRQRLSEMQTTVEDARVVSENATVLLKEYLGQQKVLQHQIRVDQQLLNCNIAQISQYTKIATDNELKMAQANDASVYGITATEAFSLHGELSQAQEKIIELEADSNLVTMRIIAAQNELANVSNTMRAVEKQSAAFAMQRTALEGHNLQAKAQERLVKGVQGTRAMQDVYHKIAVVYEGVKELETKLRISTITPLAPEDKIPEPENVTKAVANKQYWQEQLSRTLPYLRNK